MFLKYLELQGFKSFPDKTRIMFNKGLTAVVGPNGSGKSNISDAIRWVMGEQSNKNLRGESMEAVIFTGTKSRKSQGFAEVSLCIDNSDKTLLSEYDEVVITRRYSRSGDSDYMINRSNVRLKDINELFMDTGLGKDGYAMVGQGKIAEIVQSKSDERRVIFEEAAGISKFRARKNEAQKKLSAAEENLVRLRDILQELSDRVAPLKAQSEKAKKFIALAEEKKTTEISAWMHTLEQSNARLKDHADKILARQQAHDETQAEIEKIENEIQDVYSQMQKCLSDIDELRREKQTAQEKMAALSSSVAVCENDMFHNNQNRERIEGEVETFRKTGEAFGKEVLEKYSVVEKDKVSRQDIIAEIAEQETALEQLLKRSNEFSNSRSVLGARQSELLVLQAQHRQNLMQLTTTSEELSERFQNNSESMEQKRENFEQIKAELQNANELFEALEERNSLLSNTASGYKLKLQNKRETTETLQSDYNKLDLQIKEKKQRARLLQDLEKNMDGYAYSVKTVLTRGKNGVLSGVLGTVSQLLTVPEEYGTALDTALGGSQQHIVVETENDGKNAISFLKRENAGRATFLPLTAIRGNRLVTAPFENVDGFVALACDLVKFDERFQNVVYSLLGRIVIVEDLDAAVRIAKNNGYRFKIVTLDGQVVNAGGSMSGGSKNKSQGFLSRKTDISRLLTQAAELELSAENTSISLEQVKQELGTLKAKLTAVNSEIITVNEDKIRCEGEQKRLSLTIEQEKNQLSNMQEELCAHKQKTEENEAQSTAIKQEIFKVETELKQVYERLNSVQGENDEYQEAQNNLTQLLSSLRYKKLEIEKNIELEERTILEMKQRDAARAVSLENLQTQIKELVFQNSQIASEIENRRTEISSIKEKTAKNENLVLEKTAQRNLLDGQTTTLRQNERTLSAQRERQGQDLARFEEQKLAIQKEYDTIINKLWEEYQLTKSEAITIAIPIQDVDETNKLLASLKSQIKALGSVNVAAIEEYLEVSERYEFLNTQLQDVEKSKNELTHLISELTSQMQEIFLKNFREINVNFSQIFVELFGGGRAGLKLTDESDILNCGIEIFVEPPGKIIKSLMSLSGGEQAFIAIAIYFAILKVRPAPFCVLDEIEAALDDVNVTKYAKYLRSMSDKTQFIMITHRRGSMEEADVLYGVTMQEEGVSKLLQLNVTEIAQDLSLT